VALSNYHYSYLVGVLIFWVAWILCSIFGKNYRAEIRWGTLIAAPMALTSLLFVPQYWSPPSLFNLDQRIRVGIEDFLWAAAVGGIASVVGELLLKEKLAALRRLPRERHYAPFAVMVVIFVALELWHPNKTIYNTIAAFAAGAVVIAFLRSDLVPLMLISAMSFTALYFFLFLCLLYLYPEFVDRFYNVPNLLGIYVLGVPIEELLFAATGGAIWSVAYEYVQGYRLSPLSLP
jgi:Lycopene cyclase